ncbi:MAG: hypothetical protein K8W52_15440 [Deltaproteobacteria bacterium]|nr:hypothetical protein [Deltaproteobacteria bacterium]
MRNTIRCLSFSALAVVACTDRSGPDPAFDVAYPAAWTFSVSGPADGFLVVVNTSDKPLDMHTLAVTSVSDDHPSAEVRATVSATPRAVIPPGMAGGLLSGLSRDLMVSSGLVPEAFSDSSTSYLALELTNAPPGTYDIAAKVSLTLDGRDVALPLTIHVVPGPTVYLDPADRRRVQVFR